ncbi:Hypothetical protein A7982_03986 [Minicystis rosea]|nr:Hypothetical protein A7982_03986 [Minicystis rosea]
MRLVNGLDIPVIVSLGGERVTMLVVPTSQSSPACLDVCPAVDPPRPAGYRLIS